MRTALVLLPLFAFAFACSTPAPPAPPAPIEPPPAPAPEPVKIEQAPEPAVADCVDLTFTDGAAGTYTVVDGGESHEKRHFTMPEGKDALVLTTTWPDATWEMEVAAGVGNCPHAGTTHATVTATGNARIFLPASQLAAETATFTAGETWFLHLDAKGEHAAGANVAYTIAGQACVIAKPTVEPLPLAAPGPDHHVLQVPQVLKTPAGTSVHEKKAAGTGKVAKGKGQ